MGGGGEGLFGYLKLLMCPEIEKRREKNRRTCSFSEYLTGMSSNKISKRNSLRTSLVRISPNELEYLKFHQFSPLYHFFYNNSEAFIQ